MWNIFPQNTTTCTLCTLLFAPKYSTGSRSMSEVRKTPVEKICSCWPLCHQDNSFLSMHLFCIQLDLQIFFPCFWQRGEKSKVKFKFNTDMFFRRKLNTSSFSSPFRGRSSPSISPSLLQPQLCMNPVHLLLCYICKPPLHSFFPTHTRWIFFFSNGKAFHQTFRGWWGDRLWKVYVI